MKFALYCPCCQDRAVLPGRSEDGSTFDQEAVIDAFTTMHATHLVDDQSIEVLDVPDVAFWQSGTREVN